jgi:predicted alpha/beta hydrolase
MTPVSQKPLIPALWSAVGSLVGLFVVVAAGSAVCGFLFRLAQLGWAAGYEVLP